MKKPFLIRTFRVLSATSLLTCISFMGMKAPVIAVETPPSPTFTITPLPPPPVEEESRLKDILFDPNEYNIRPDAKPVLKENADAWAQILKKFPKATLIIEGYSDMRGADEYNLRLAQERADATKAYIVRLGADSKKIKAISKGSTTKFSFGSTEEGFQLNRRARFILNLTQASKSTASISTSTTTGAAQKSPIPNLTLPRELSKIIEYELKKIAPKEITFTPPREMKVGVSARVDARISKRVMEDLHAGLRRYKLPQVEKIKIVQPMKIHLTGHNFHIKALNEGEQLLSEKDPIQWGWDVSPLKSGTQSLTLTVSVRINTPSYEEIKEYPLYVKAIKVKFNPIYSTINFVKGHWQWIFGAIIVSGVVMWVVKRQKA